MLGVSRPIAKRQRNSTTKDVEKSLARQLGRVWSQGVTNQRKAQQKMLQDVFWNQLANQNQQKTNQPETRKTVFVCFRLFFFLITSWDWQDGRLPGWHDAAGRSPGGNFIFFCSLQVSCYNVRYRYFSPLVLR